MCLVLVGLMPGSQIGREIRMGFKFLKFSTGGNIWFSLHLTEAQCYYSVTMHCI